MAAGNPDFDFEAFARLRGKESKKGLLRWGVVSVALFLAAVLVLMSRGMFFYPGVS